MCIKDTVRHAKLRSIEKSVPFSLTIDYLVSIFPPDSICPVFGTPMVFGGKGNGQRGGTYNSPSIDRIVPELGYVPDNVIWVSQLANAIKQTASVDQLFAVAQFYQRLMHNPTLFVPGHTIH